MPELANSVSLMYKMILFKTSSVIQVSFVESMYDESIESIERRLRY